MSTSHLFVEPSAHSFFGNRGNPAGEARLALAGVPYDLGNGVAAGTREAPARLRAASQEESFRLPPGTVTDLGDLRFVYGEEPAAVLERLGEAVDALSQDGIFPLVVGGDHSISYPVVQRLSERHDLAVVWLDAHTDFSHRSGRGAHDHKQVLRRIWELPGVRRVVLAGHRGYTVDNELQLDDGAGGVSLPELRRRGPAPILDSLPKDLPCYVSLDIDVLDPRVAPGTSTPVPGGFTLSELEDLLSAVLRERRILGMDLVEINPFRDIAGRTCLTGCRLLLTAIAHLSSVADGIRGRERG